MVIHAKLQSDPLERELFQRGLYERDRRPTPGQTTNLGTLYLCPVDANTNGLADHWEERYLGANERRRRRIPMRTGTTIIKNTCSERIRRIETVR